MLLYACPLVVLVVRAVSFLLLLLLLLLARCTNMPKVFKVRALRLLVLNGQLGNNTMTPHKTPGWNKAQISSAVFLGW